MLYAPVVPIDPEELRELLAAHGADPYAPPAPSVYYGPGHELPRSTYHEPRATRTAAPMRPATRPAPQPAPRPAPIEVYTGPPWTDDQREIVRAELRQSPLWVEVAPGVFRFQQV